MAFTYSVLPTAETFIAFHSLFYTAFPIPGIRKDVCAALRPAFQGTEGRTGATAACLVPLHAGAPTDVETTRYSALRGILLVVALVRSVFYPYHSIPGRLRHGQTVTHSALCRPSYLRMPQGGKSPLCVCPADHCLSRPAVVPFILSIPTGSIPARQTIVCPARPLSPLYYPSQPVLFRQRRQSLSTRLIALVFVLRAVTARGFVRCECRLPHLFPPF